MGKDDENKFFSNSNSMNGLVNFIGELRACRAHDLEQKRVNKELANIRAKFKDGNLNGYNKKKYVAKLLYMYILGFEVDIGHLEAVTLMQSIKFQEKQIAYLAVTMMISETHELAPLVVNSLRKDLDDHNENFNCLAIHAVTNICSREICEMMALDIYKIFTSTSRSSLIRKKAGLCLLRIYRKFPELVSGEDWAPSILKALEDKNLAISHAAICLVTALAQEYEETYSAAVSIIVNRLHQIVVKEELSENNQYYHVTSPWLQIKFLRFLQYYPAPVEPSIVTMLDKVVLKIISKANETHKKQQQTNATNAVLFEAINLVIHMDATAVVIHQITEILGSFLASKETNQRYLALETMAHLAAMGDPLQTLGRFQNLVFDSLKDKDVSVRRQGLNLLYSMCSFDNAQAIVGELLKYLDYSDHEIREEMVLKIAILAEKFVTEYTWYVDVMLKLITTAGDDASDALWHRVVYIVTNNEDLREYATYTIFQAVKQPQCHEMTVKVGAYLMGEYGHVIVEAPGCSPYEQFMALHSKFGLFSTATRCLLLNTYVKFVNLFPEIKAQIKQVFESVQYALDMELQQRACEYLALIDQPTDQLLQAACAEMPQFPEKESMLLVQLKKKVNDTEEKRVWTIGGKEEQQELSVKRTSNTGRKPSVVQRSVKTSQPSDDLLGLSVVPEQVIQEKPTQEQIQSWYEHLLVNPNGILYEDNIIQIGIKTEYQGHLGRIAVFYGNKTSVDLSYLESFIEPLDGMLFTVVQPIANTLPSLTQAHQMFSVESLNATKKQPVLEIAFKAGGQDMAIELVLPVTVTKFVVPVQLQQEDFFGRWRQIGGPPREVVAMFKPKKVDVQQAKEKLSGLGLELLPAVDPNPANCTGACIFSASAEGKVGCLIRLESNTEHQVLRLTIALSSDGTYNKRKCVCCFVRADTEGIDAIGTFRMSTKTNIQIEGIIGELRKYTSGNTHAKIKGTCFESGIGANVSSHLLWWHDCGSVSAKRP
ncbi:adaptin N terminal region-domain-containing protein [Gorgonomyces haynaldii]|nr:adaptin N terminal region-domain-containing protein [Gorgonomyces haynaldii]